MESITYSPIGIINTPFSTPVGTPIQPVSGKGVDGTVEIFPEFEEGLSDLDGFSHIHLLFHMDRAPPMKLRATPFVDTIERGIFSIRAPSRPNPIGMSIVQLVRIDGNVLHIRDLDILDGTPLLDIKPYIPKTDCNPDARIGWLEGKEKRFSTMKADDRFVE